MRSAQASRLPSEKKIPQILSRASGSLRGIEPLFATIPGDGRVFLRQQPNLNLIVFFEEVELDRRVHIAHISTAHPATFKAYGWDRKYLRGGSVTTLTIPLMCLDPRFETDAVTDSVGSARVNSDWPRGPF
jgi:hypothetical protein